MQIVECKTKNDIKKFKNFRKKLYENDMSRGATLSMQSLNPLTLKNIGRENITKEKFSELPVKNKVQKTSSGGAPPYKECLSVYICYFA